MMHLKKIIPSSAASAILLALLLSAGPAFADPSASAANPVTLGTPPASSGSYSGTTATPKADVYSGLVKCSGVVAVDANGAALPGQVPCDFNYFIITVADLINWAFYISLPIMVVLFSWAGILYISGVEKNIGRAKGIFLNTAIGFIIMLAAFTIVHTLVGWLVDPSFGAESFLSK